eukprot:TRINITY_DN13130_c0_g1_i1.p1 TRINITY_DN13130_c0_g1~~TRINITY_DN13130_c0_g1_i1.p1  ORF type:complete len:963 (-),score=103.12 TRINITY_DN13130_c0_g1_i1:132-3020(-)
MMAVRLLVATASSAIASTIISAQATASLVLHSGAVTQTETGIGNAAPREASGLRKDVPSRHLISSDYFHTLVHNHVGALHSAALLRCVQRWAAARVADAKMWLDRIEGTSFTATDEAETALDAFTRDVEAAATGTVIVISVRVQGDSDHEGIASANATSGIAELMRPHTSNLEWPSSEMWLEAGWRSQDFDGVALPLGTLDIVDAAFTVDSCRDFASDSTGPAAPTTTMPAHLARAVAAACRAVGRLGRLMEEAAAERSTVHKLLWDQAGQESEGGLVLAFQWIAMLASPSSMSTLGKEPEFDKSLADPVRRDVHPMGARFRFFYEVQVGPSFRSRVVREAFQDTPGSVRAFVLGDVCVRDLYSRTAYKYTPDINSIPLGHRIELLTVGLSRADHQLLRNAMGLLSRIVLTVAGSLHELEENLRGGGGPVTYLPGMTMLLYDGHSGSGRCPDCSNIGHHLVDDLFADLFAWYQWRDSIGVDFAALNLHASFGRSGAKRWFRGLLEAVVRRAIRPSRGTILVGRDETVCFARVSLTTHSSEMDPASLWRDASIQPAIVAARHALYVHHDVRPAEELAPLCPATGIAYGRQTSTASTQKQRRWTNMNDVVAAVRGRSRVRLEVVDLGQLNFVEQLRLLANTDLVISVPGAGVAMAFFLRPRSLWFDLICPNVTDRLAWLHPEVVNVNGERPGGLAALYNIRYRAISRRGCPSLSPNARHPQWVPFYMHPLFASADWKMRRSWQWSTPVACAWERPRIHRDLETSAVPLTSFKRKDDAQEACAAIGPECSAVLRTHFGAWLLRYGKPIPRSSGMGGMPAQTLVKKSMCVETRMIERWNETSLRGCTGAPRRRDVCVAGVLQCRALCSGAAWCVGAVCLSAKESAGCQSPHCNCRLCADLPPCRRNDPKGDAYKTEVHLRLPELMQARVYGRRDYRSNNVDVSVGPQRVLAALDDLGCDLLKPNSH